ncbi:dihydrofolate reductase [uncultured Dechloromonas sp.]|uniref:dihydrofolate reductase n=1 Tax=uncultured Dechloromonas sp. TaxID=171719 RepID=UPI0025F189DB|nr:dihydrofolate reductase [uncultured Dechloromonas sp.]
MGKDPALISAIGAVSANGMIGLDGWLPWDIPEELAYFETTVAGAALLIGRLTYESMDVVPEDSFVVSRRADIAMRPGCTRVATVEDGLRRALATGKPVFVIGGASIYAAAWRYCQRFWLTRIERDFDGDSAFPETVDLGGWAIESENRRYLRERKTDTDVMCRFLVYRQDNPLPLPFPNCNSSGA